jgi:hypothetical protein
VSAMAPISHAAVELQNDVRDLYRLLDAAQARDDGNGEDSEYGRELQRVRSVASVLASFVEQSRSGWATGPDASSSYVDSIEVVERLALSLAVKNLQNELGHRRVSDQDLQQLVQMRILLAQPLGAAIDQVRTAADDTRDLEFLSSLAVRLAGPMARDVLTDAAAVSKAKTAQQETAGATAENELSKEFAKYGRWQQLAGYLWLLGALVLLTVAVVVAWLALKQIGHGFNWYSVTTHVLIVLPCLAFSAYSARESSRHREIAHWAHRLAVQLKSVGAYTARLDESSRKTLLAQFGGYVFGPHPMGTDDNQMQTIPPEILSAIADVIRKRGRAEA